MEHFLEHLALPTDPQTILLLVFSVVLILSSTYFVLHIMYQDGVVGKAFLWGIVFSCAIIFGSIFTNIEYDVSNDILMLIGSFTGFHCWHLWVFHRRCSGKKKMSATALAPHDRRRLDRRWNPDEANT